MAAPKYLRNNAGVITDTNTAVTGGVGDAEKIPALDTSGKLALAMMPGGVGPSAPTVPGEDGEDGNIGPPGNIGPTGAPGVNGQQGPPGQEGEVGEQGEVGAPGAQGFSGATGLTGTQGPPGFTGEDGEPGEVGPPGNTGSTGAAGVAGEQGPPGPVGDQGEPGDLGPPGNAGPQGVPGVSGELGPPGLAGEQGEPGEIGPPGNQGTQGAAGPQGFEGLPGAPGQDGEDGSIGPPGVAGTAGAAGSDGAQGVPGIAGEDGEDGPAGAPGNVGAQGSQGIQGVDGPPGPSGEDGADGAIGPPGAAGTAGAAGATGVDGIPGMPGEDGADGAIGPPGNIGLQGTAGVQGAAGVDGIPGAPGEDGEDGVIGPPGNQGLTGTSGAEGAAGATGLMGPPGVIGDEGEPGSIGPPGNQGIDGAAGAPGVAGAAGSMGPPGTDGEDGADGSMGPPGNQGPAGADGIIGVDGVMGPPGADGEDGVDGFAGPPGNQGADGAPGTIGVDGSMGPPGPAGDDGDSEGGGSFGDFVARSGDTMSGKLNTPASVASNAGINIGEGVAPTSPVNGDVWIVGQNLTIRSSGSTKTTMNTTVAQSVSGRKTFIGTASVAALNAQHTTPTTGPSVPVDGDLWGGDGGLFMHYKGARMRVLFADLDGLAGPPGCDGEDGTPGFMGLNGTAKPTTSLGYAVLDLENVFTKKNTIGGTAQTPISGLNSLLQVQGDGVNDWNLSLAAFTTAALGAANFTFARSRNATIGAHTIVQNNDAIGNFQFFGSNGTGFDPVASILVEVDDVPGASNDMPGRLVFGTTLNGSASVSERFRISNFGGFGIGGANFGTDKQAFISGGAAAAPSWRDVDRDILLAGYDLTNQVENAWLEKGDFGFTKGTGWVIESDAANARSGNWVAKNTDTSGVARALTNIARSACVPGDTVYAEVWVKTSASPTITVLKAQINWYDKDNAFLSSSDGTNYTTEQASYVRSNVTAVAPATAVFYAARVVVTKTVGTVWADTFFAATKRRASDILVDSSVTTSAFLANKNGTAQNFTTATATKVTFGTEEFDAGSEFASSTFTPLTAGKYNLECATRVTAFGVGTTSMRLHLYKNAALYKTFMHIVALAGLTDVTLQGTVILDAAAGDTYEIYIEFVGLTSGTATIGGAIADTYFCGSRFAGGVGDVNGPSSSLDGTVVLFNGATGKLIEDSQTILPLKGYIWALTLSNAADTVNDITVAAGEATDEGGARVMVLPSTITKRLDAAWAVGDAAGGLNTGAKANSTWYEVHLIKRVDTGVVDVMFTTTANRATLPANYTLQRRIGWIFNNATPTILAFTHVGDHFTLATPINDVSLTATATAASVTLTVPPNSIARFRATTIGNTGVNASMVLRLYEIAELDGTPAEGTGLASLAYIDLASPQAGHFELRANASSQIRHDSSAATGSPTFDISTFGWIDHRRRMSAI